jgi:Family of unknown function (DUF6350)
MVARALFVTAQQALRSIAILLLPLTFLSLLAWSTAGSLTGNTTDPIRAGIWLWLGFHLVPFTLHLPPNHVHGALTILPLGGALFAFFVIRDGFRRSSRILNNERAARVFFGFWYFLAIFLSALFGVSSSIAPNLFLLPIYAVAIIFLSTLQPGTYLSELIARGRSFLAIMLGCGFIGIGLSLAAHLKISQDISTLLQTGWVGGILLLALQILYLPNLALAALGYFFGAGFTLGAHTQIDPLHFTLTQIPAIPLVSALPTGRHPLFLLALLLPAALLLYLSFQLEFRTYVSVGAILLLALTILAYMSQGELITHALNPVGVQWWRLSAVTGMAMVIVLIPSTIFRTLQARK